MKIKNCFIYLHFVEWLWCLCKWLLNNHCKRWTHFETNILCQWCWLFALKSPKLFGPNLAVFVKSTLQVVSLWFYLLSSRTVEMWMWQRLLCVLVLSQWEIDRERERKKSSDAEIKQIPYLPFIIFIGIILCECVFRPKWWKNWCFRCILTSNFKWWYCFIFPL